jgi:uncharacterized membrane protein
MSKYPTELESLVRSLVARLESLEREVRELRGERKSPETAESQDVAEMEFVQRSEQPVPPPLPVTPPTAPPTAAPIEVQDAPAGKRESLREMLEHAADAAAERGRGATPGAPPIAPPIAPRKKAAKPKLNLEMLVGGRALAAAGALILVVGFGLFLKFAYDQGWLRVAPVIRCVGGAGFGLMLVGLGEFARKRWGALAASGVTAAGLGVLYTAVFAAYKLFGLVGPGVGFVLLAVTALFGVAVGARARLVVVAALSLVAGYVTPFLFAGSQSAVWALPSHLLMLLAIGLGMAGWLRGTFVTLRMIVWWGTVLIGGFWVIGQRGLPATETTTALVFQALAWAAIQVELIVSASRGPLSEPGAMGRWLDSPFVAMLSRWRPLVSSVSTTVWLVGLGSQLGVIPAEWVLPLGVGGLTLFASSFLAGMLTPVFERPTNDRQRLAAVYLVQSAALLLLAIALAVSGLGQVLAWVLLGAGAAVAGKWLRARAFEVYALVALALAAGRLLLYDSWVTPLPTKIASVGPVVVSQWMIGVLLCAAGWVGTGLIMRRGGEQRRWANAGEWAATVGCLLVGASIQRSDGTTTTVAGGAAVSLLLAGLLSVWLGSVPLRAGATAAFAAGLLTVIAGAWWDSPRTGEIAGLVWGEGVGAAYFIAAFVLVIRAVDRWRGVDHEGTFRWWREWPEMAFPATLLVVGGPMHHESSPLAVSAYVMVCGVVWLAYASLRPATIAAWHAAVVAVAGTLYWFAACVVRRSPFEESGLIPALLVCGVYAGTVIAMRKGWGTIATVERQGVVGMAATGVGLFFAATSFEVARVASSFAADAAVRGSAVSIYWGVFAVALIGAGFVARIAWVRYAGLALIAVASVKAVVFDLGSVPQGWRIASFIGLGVLMLGVHFTYSRLSERLLGKREEEAEE